MIAKETVCMDLHLTYKIFYQQDRRSYLVDIFFIRRFSFFQSYPINLNHSCLGIFRKLTLGIFLQNRAIFFFISYLEISVKVPFPSFYTNFLFCLKPFFSFFKSLKTTEFRTLYKNVIGHCQNFQ